MASVLCSDQEACWILAPWPGIEPEPLELEDEVLTTGPPGKSRKQLFFFLQTPIFNWALTMSQALLPISYYA